MTDPRKLILMGDALVRATKRIAQAKRPLIPSTVEHDPPIRRSIKDQLAEHLATYEAMRDDELALERASLETSIENIRIELRLDQEGESLRERGWRARAEHALSGLKGQANLCRLEIDKRRRYDAEQTRVEKQAEMERQRIEKQAEMERQRIEKEQRQAAHEKFLREGEERRLAKQRANTSELHARTQAFVRNAERFLPRETFAAIWTAVDEEARDGGDRPVRW